MKANYKAFIDRLIGKYEGGYSWHPEDPGGPTNFGITCYDLAEHRHMSMNSMGGWANLVRQMPESEAEDIYAEKYAKGIRFDELNSGVDVVMLDYAVNSGVERPIHVACTLIGRPVVDHIDDELLRAINGFDPNTFINRMCAERLRFMHAIRGGRAWITFGKGWMARVTDLRNYALALRAGGTAPEAPDLASTVTPKAKHVGNTAPKTTAGGAVAASVAAHVAGLPLWAVVLAGAAVLILGVMYEAWSEKQALAANLEVHL